MDSFVAVVAIILNLALWAVFFSRLSRRLSIRRFTDETRAELEKTITELNGIVARNISIIDDKIAALNSLSSERIAEMKELSESIDRKILLQRQASERAVGAMPAEHGISATMDTYRAAGLRFRQAQVSAEPEMPARSAPQNGSSAAMEEKAPVRDFAARVRELHLNGISPDVIASRLSRTVSEVQLVLDMNNF